MGVHGLWQLLQPTGRPVTLESLEGKVLGVDVSIWLNQTLKGMRDRHGNPLPNAHLLGLFHRVCKLLYYRVKPVFVFDGGVPALKRQTLSNRRRRKEEAADKSSKAAKKLLTNLLKHHAVSTVLGEGEAALTPLNPPQASTSREQTLYELPSLPEPAQETESTEAAEVDDEWENRMAQRDAIYDEFQDLDDVNLESEDFKELPPEIQHEILTELKEKRKKNSWAKLDELPEDSSDFANYQLRKILKQSKLSQKLYDVRKELNSRSSGAIACQNSDEENEKEVAAHKIMSEDATHVILIKNKKINESPTKKLKSESEVTDAESSGIDTSAKVIPSKETDNDCRPSTSKLFSVEKKLSEPLGTTKNEVQDFVDLSVQDAKSEDNNACSVNGISINSRSQTVFDLTKDNSTEIPDKTDLTYSMEGGFIREESNDEAQSKIEIVYKVGSSETESLGKLKYESTVNNASICNTKAVIKISSTEISEIKYMSATEATNVTKTNEAEASDETGYFDAGSNKNNQEDIPKLDPPAENITNNSETESEEDDFIEVTIDTKLDKPDDLFPASVFQNPVIDVTDDTIESKNDIISVIEKSEVSETTTNPLEPATDLVSDINVSKPESVVGDIENQSENVKKDEVVPTIEEPADSADTATIPPPQNEYIGMSQEELVEIKDNIEKEQKTLTLERGKQERLAASVTDQMQAEAQELLRLFGVPYLVSPMEAEAQCAKLELNSLTQGSITDDSDIWLFGGKLVYRNVFNQNKYVELYKSDDIKANLTLDRVALVNIALLCGSDYTDGVPGVGPVTAMEILGEFPGDTTFEKLCSFKEWWEAAQQQAKAIQETKVKAKLRHLEVPKGFPSERVVDAYLNPTVDESEESFSWGIPNLDLLRDYAMEKFGWTKNKTDEQVLPVLKQLNQREVKPYTQSHITRFFTTDLGKNENTKSKRLKRVLNRLNNKEEDISELSPKKKLKQDIMEVRKAKAKKVLQGQRGRVKGLKGRGRGKMRDLSPVRIKEQRDGPNLSECSSDSD